MRPHKHGQYDTNPPPEDIPFMCWIGLHWSKYHQGGFDNYLACNDCGRIVKHGY